MGYRVYITFGIYFCLQLLGITGFAQESVNEVYQRGIQLEREKEYDGALWELNKAMGMVKQNYNHPLREKIEEAIRVTKGKMVVARYTSRRRVSAQEGDGLDVLENEPKDFRVSQVFGAVLARKIWEDRDRLATDEFVGIGRTITVLPKGGIELEENQIGNFNIRSVEAASFTLSTENHLSLHSGSYCIHTIRGPTSLNISSAFTDLQVNSEQPYAFMVGITTNGGMKVIGLLGRISLAMNGEEQELLPGQLVFCLPAGFSRKMDVELNTLILTSKLLNSFKKAPVFEKKLQQQALLQALRTQNRFRTTVGDVRGNKNFEVKVFPED
ncbi:MAG: hypothetical protein VW576_09780 [Opitutae bacterium]